MGGVECDVASGAIREAALVEEVETCRTGLAGIRVACAGGTGGMAQSADIWSWSSIIIVVVSTGTILMACNIEQKSPMSS